MNLEILTEFVKIDIIRYLIIATIALGLMYSLRLLIRGR